MIAITPTPKQQLLTRDILWVQESAPLLQISASSCLLQNPNPIGCSVWHPAACDTEILERRFAEPYRPLGIRYEIVWQHILESRPETTLLAHNLQVNGSEKTLGEFDLIYNNRLTKRCYHRELAIKFYLGLPSSLLNSSPWQHWVGPTIKDRLDLKVDYLLNHQIKLASSPDGQEILRSKGIDTIEPEILLQGYLFYPVYGDCPPPIHSNPKHFRGQWLNISRLGQWLAVKPPANQYFILAKSFWLTPFYGNIAPSKPLTRYQLVDQLSHELIATSSPPLIAACSNENGVLQEQERFFVVPDQWQEEANRKSEEKR